MTSKRSEIAEALETAIIAIPQIKTCSYTDIRLLASDFKEFELPRVQIIDMAEESTHEMGRALKSWNVSLEIVIGPSPTYTPSQTDLWDLLQLVEEGVFSNPKLGLPYVTQMTLLGSMTDLHILSPFFTSRIDLQINYYQPLTYQC